MYLLGDTQFGKLFEWFRVPNFVIVGIENQRIPKIGYDFVPDGLRIISVLDKRLKEAMQGIFLNVPTRVTLAIGALLMDCACSWRNTIFKYPILSFLIVAPRSLLTIILMGNSFWFSQICLSNLYILHCSFVISKMLCFPYCC